MLLKFRKEQEHGIYISETITDEQDIMYPVYQQAVQALRSIVRQAKAFKDNGRKTNALGVYGYCHNIIAFSGSRGQGKTSAMLSFSRALENSFPSKEAHWREDSLDKCRFTVLPPIDPTVLEQDQSILAVVLSRMYRLAEDEWEKACSRYSFSGDSSADEAQRNILLRRFQECLSGINNVKFRKGEEIRGLIEMHEISDSAVLKDNFNKLTTSLLKFVQKNSDGITPFLVVQLDDTDFQVRKSYEIMEDIRKYLTVPNIIILMATDLNMLRATLTQNLVRDFYLKMDRENLKGIIDINKLWKIESKHLDKLIPPTRAICLPHLDSIIREQSEDIHIKYWEQDDQDKKRDILQLPDPNNPGEGKRLSMQESVFQFVYQKTRIVFIDSRTSPHKMLPTTLRGLAQFLVVLSSMRSVPAIDNLDDHFSPQELSRLVSAQVEILETNLSRFESYFLNDWIHAKLPVKKAGLFETLMTAETERQFWCAGKALQELYEESVSEADKKIFTYEQLMAYVRELEGRFLEPDDVYVFFAIRMFFDFQAHRMIARQKKRALEEQKKSHDLIIFDFTQSAQNLPNTLSLDGTRWDLLIKDLRKDQYQRILRGTSSKSFGRVLFRKKEDDIYRFDPFYFIPFFLSLGKAEYKDMMRGETDQRLLYLVQTTCATIAINKDVQDTIRKALQENPPPLTGNCEYLSMLDEFFRVVSNAVKGINDGADDNAQMIACWIEEIPKFMTNEKTTDFRKVLSRLEAELTKDHLKSLRSIYRLAKYIFNAVSSMTAAGDSIEAQKLWQRFVDASIKYSDKDGENGIKAGLNLNLLEDLLLGPASSPAAAANDFWKEFDREILALCNELDYDIELVKRDDETDSEKTDADVKSSKNKKRRQ